MTVADRIQAHRPAVRSALAIVLIPVAAVVAWLLVFEPIHWVVTSQAQWREATSTELARARGHARVLEVVQKQVEELPSAAIWQRFYPAATAGAVSSAVQKDVAELSAAAGLENPSIVALPSETAGAIDRQLVRLSANGTADRLEAFLTRLRQQPRYLRVDRLTVSAPQAQGADQNPILIVTMDIAGYTHQSERGVKGRT
jgi:Tfp pilus assembly protein PilO